MRKISWNIIGRVLFYSACIVFIFAIFGNWSVFRGVGRASFFTLSYLRTAHVAQIMIGDLTVEVYCENNIVFQSEDVLRLVIEKAYSDLPVYLGAHYSELLEWKRMSSVVKVVILSEQTYEFWDQSCEGLMGDSTLGIYLPLQGTAYIRCIDNRFDAARYEMVVRHELFHHFYHTYDLDNAFNEWNAYEFDSVVQTRRH